MKWSEAYEAMIEGKQVKREAWNHPDDDNNKFCLMVKKMPHIWQIQYKPNPSAGIWMATRTDLAADDWILIEGLGEKEDVVVGAPEVL